MKKKLLIVVVVLILILICCAITLSAAAVINIYKPVQIEGSSMEPNYKAGEIRFINSSSSNFKTGDVVVINKNGLRLVKRIIAKGGDSIEFKEGDVYLNGNVVDESSFNVIPKITFGGNFIGDDVFIEVPENSFVVLGDNRRNSLDSRNSQIGFIKLSEIEGKL